MLKQFPMVEIERTLPGALTHLSGLTAQEAYIAVTATGFVDGACFTESSDTATWVEEMKAAGMRVDRVSRSEAKRVLFAQLTPMPTN